MNYIFLDIDGVLNSNNFIKEHIDDDVILDRNAIKLLSKLVTETHSKVVLSSSWRLLFTEKGNPRRNTQTQRGVELKRLLKKNNIEIISRTRVAVGKHGNLYDDGKRYDEIVDYINKNLNPDDKYIVLDDEDFYGSLNQFGEKFIQISFWTGLQEEDVEKGIKILGSDN